MTNLEKYLYQLRRIEEHRAVKAEKEIRKIYKELLKELNGYLGNIYATYSEGDELNYSSLAKAGMDARFLEEVEQRINSVTPKVAKQIQETVEATYTACYDGMVDAVKKAGSNRELLQKAFESVSAVTPDALRANVNNPVSGLTLKDTLEKHRKDIIYDIKKNIGVGLSNGDRFSTMAKRIAESVDGDYTKSVRIVRTEAHRVRESGFNDAATSINDTLKQGKSGYVMAKTWRTMQDERVRPNKAKGKSKKYNHVKMDGVTIPQDELFKLPSGATCMCPSKTGVAGEDINCRCYLTYDLVLASELTKVQDGKKTIEEAAKVEQTEMPAVVEYKTGSQDDFNRLSKEHGKIIGKENEAQIKRHDKPNGDTNGGYVATHNYSVINSNMRKDNYTGTQLDDDDIKTIETMRAAIGKCKLDDDYTFTRYVNADYLSSVFGVKTRTWSKGELEDIADSITRVSNKYVVTEAIPNITKELQAHIGECITEKSFISASMLPNKNIMQDKSVVFKINARKGTNCYVTRNKKESECIFGDNTTLYVTDIIFDENSRKWVITADIG